jgi:hypothetical protein
MEARWYASRSFYIPLFPAKMYPLQVKCDLKDGKYSAYALDLEFVECAYDIYSGRVPALPW